MAASNDGGRAGGETHALDVVAVNAGVSTPSSSRLLSDRLTTALAATVAERGGEARTSTIELREYAHDITDAAMLGFAGKRLADVVRQVVAADALIVVSPVFSASYSGLFKSFFDIVDVGALNEKPVLLGATAGTPRHSLVLEHAMRPLFAYLGALTVPTAVFAASDDWAGAGDGDSLGRRIVRAATQLADLVVPAGGVSAPAGSASDLDAPFGGTPTFATLLARS